MWEWIIEKLMTRIQTKRNGMQNYTGNICPNIVKKINKQKVLANICYLRWCGRDEFEIHHNLNKYIVDLDKRTCTCGMFQLSGIPCCHAIPAIDHKRGSVEDFLDDCYKKPTYMKVYEHMVHGVPGQSHYILTGIEPLRPPKYQTKTGRPKKMRRSCVDEKEKSTSTRKGLTHVCSNCLKAGHNKKSCRNPTHPQSKPNKEKQARRRKKRVESSKHEDSSAIVNSSAVQDAEVPI